MKKKEGNQSTLRKKLFVALVSFLFLVLLVASFFGKRGLVGVFQAQRERTNLQREILRLKEQKARLEKEIEELKENPLAVDEKAREKLWLMRPDEVVILKSGDPSSKTKDPGHKN